MSNNRNHKTKLQQSIEHLEQLVFNMLKRHNVCCLFFCFPFYRHSRASTAIIVPIQCVDNVKMLDVSQKDNTDPL